jgi:hypothetical protein
MTFIPESDVVTEEALNTALAYARANNQGLPNQGFAFIESALLNACIASASPLAYNDHKDAAAYIAGIVDRAKYDFPQESSLRNFMGAARNFANRTSSFEAGRQFYSDHKFSANFKSLEVIIEAYAKICDKIGVADEINTIRSGGMSLAHA